MSPEDQNRFLSRYSASFTERLGQFAQELSVSDCFAIPALRPATLATMQINVGKLCNQACTHCHVEASPTRTEHMTHATADRCLEIVDQVKEIKTVDITGGAPEMHHSFRHLVVQARRLNRHVIDRCNLTILELPGYEYLYDFLSEHEVEIIASMPYFAESHTRKQRGLGVFEKSIKALQNLNRIGYGDRLPLNLVYNPVGAFLAGSQSELERDFKKHLGEKYGITFNSLFCINNFPIGRFLKALIEGGKFEAYMERLISAYNPDTVPGLMCRHHISIGWDGSVYDCDFNQMLDLPAQPVSHIDHFDYNRFINRKISVGNHCFACTAGAGSSCGGEIAN